MQLWSEETNLWLLTPYEYDQLPDGFTLTCIDGTTAVKGEVYIDQDTRFGCLAWGVVDPHNHPEKETVLVAILGAQK